jgi:hypothetical protein
MSSALDPAGQAAATEPRNLPASLALPPSRVILQKEPLDRRMINKISSRRAAGHASPGVSPRESPA